MILRSGVSTSLLLVLFVSGAAGFEDEKSQRAVKGLTAVGIVIEGFNNDPGARKIGLTEDDVQTDVELKLRLAGMRVLNKEQTGAIGAAYLYVNVIIFEDASAASISVELHQDALLYPAGVTYLPAVITWDSVSLASHPSRSGVRDSIKDKVDQFLNIWLTANPKAH